jgi:hypothetical protein
LLKHISEFDGGMDGAGRLEQCLETHDLLGEREAALIDGVGLFGGRHESG